MRYTSGPWIIQDAGRGACLHGEFIIYVCVCVGGVRFMYSCSKKYSWITATIIFAILKVNCAKDGTMWRILDVMLRGEKGKVSDYM